MLEKNGDSSVNYGGVLLCWYFLVDFLLSMFEVLFVREGEGGLEFCKPSSFCSELLSVHRLDRLQTYLVIRLQLSKRQRGLCCTSQGSPLSRTQALTFPRAIPEPCPAVAPRLQQLPWLSRFAWLP